MFVPKVRHYQKYCQNYKFTYNHIEVEMINKKKSEIF